jgi:hypothetical protein
MRRAGPGSWRFAHDLDESLHCLLYLRDALRLPIDAAGPPRLAGEIPDRSDLLGAAAARSAAAWWPSWWSAAATQWAPTQLGPPSDQVDQRRWRRELVARHRQLVDPPGWVSLAGRPALRDAASALWGEACRWFARAEQPYLPPSCHDVFAWERVRDRAERAAIDHEVSPAEVNGCAEVLLVEGSWWRLVAPGVALCSVGAARGPDMALAVLGTVFDSYLAG